MPRTRPTLKDVAEQSGYALRTVKKVMNGEQNVSDRARTAVLAAAKELNYVRNNFASALARRRDTKVAILYSEVTKTYFPEVERGFRQCEEDLRDYGMSVEFTKLYRDDVGAQQEALEKLITREDIDGLVIQPMSAATLNPLIDRLCDRIPVITFGADAVGSRRLAYFGPNAYKAGRIGAQILSNYIGKRGNVFIISRSAEHMQTVERVRGFSDRVAEHYPDVSIFTINIPDNSDLYYEMVRTVVAGEQVAALFCTDANSYIAGEVLRDLGRKDIVVVGFDMSEMSSRLMQEGYLKVMIEQSPFEFSYAALRAMFQRIYFDEIPPHTNHTGLSILTSECI